MSYPTKVEIEEATHMQLARWYRFLPSPGVSEVGTSRFQEVLDVEVGLMDRIHERFKEMGGMTPAISKAIAR